MRDKVLIEWPPSDAAECRNCAAGLLTNATWWFSSNNSIQGCRFRFDIAGTGLREKRAEVGGLGAKVKISGGLLTM